jgi:DNA polymerase III alpha subunit
MQKCKIKSIKSLGKQKTYNLTMRSNQHNYAIYDQNKYKFIISANSHAVAYTYISFMLLVLKAHYPLEFFTAILHFEELADKIKEYKCDAEKHEIKVEALDLNKSKIKFDICDDKIYFGYANVKGIGEQAAERIVKNQPYSSFSDFISRFGTDESVIKPLIGLEVFQKESKPETLYKYYKWHKDIKDKRESRKKRFEASIVKNAEECEVISHGDLSEEEKAKKLTDLLKKAERTHSGYHAKPTIDDPIPSLSEFLVQQSLKDVSGEAKEPKMDESLIELFSKPDQCEMMFYGFIWHHPIRNSPDYEGNRTFEIFKDKGDPVGYVEAMIKSATKQTSKKNKDVHYWLLKAEDANGEEGLIQVWQDDWDRFGPELEAGALVKIKIKPPDKGFNRYTLWSPKKWPKWEYDRIIPKERRFDLRLLTLRRAELTE